MKPYKEEKSHEEKFSSCVTNTDFYPDEYYSIYF